MTTLQIPLPLPHQTAMGADDFLITPCNRDAAAWVNKWPEWPSHGLIVSGLSGSGKTHLLNLWLRQSGGKLVSAIDMAQPNPIALTRDTHHIAIDDADALAGNALLEENLFHLFNYLKSVKGSLLLSLTKDAAHAGFVLPDLRSRLLTLPVAQLAAPDDELLTGLIVKQFRDRQVDLDAGVISYLVSRTGRDAAGIRDLVARLDHAALAQGRKISINLARKIIEQDVAGGENGGQ